MTILVPENRETFTLAPEAEAALLVAIEEAAADRGSFVSGEDVLRALRKD